MGKGLHTYWAKRNIPIRVAAVLFCLTLFSTYLVTGLYARYTTSAQGSDQARVAKFSIDIKKEDTKNNFELLQSVTAEVVPGETEEVTLAITNKSEVAVEYKIEVAKMTDNLPLNLSMAKQDDSTITGSETDGIITLTDQQGPGEHVDYYTLSISWPKMGTPAEELALMGMVDHITVKVTAAQID